LDELVFGNLVGLFEVVKAIMMNLENLKEICNYFIWVLFSVRDLRVFLAVEGFSQGL